MLALFVSLLAQGFEPARPTDFDEVAALQATSADPILEPHGPAKRVAYEARFSGTLHVWTKAARELDIFLRVEDAEGSLVAEDDNSGGVNTPYVKLDVEPGHKLVLHAALARDVAAGAFELHLVAAPETETTLDAARGATQALADIRALREKQDLAAARALASQVLDELVSVPDATSSDRIAAAVSGLGREIEALASLESARRALSFVLAHRARTLPADRAAFDDERFRLAIVLFRLRDLPAARALFEQSCVLRSRTLADDDPRLQAARGNLASTLYDLGEFAAAHALRARVHRTLARTLEAESIVFLDSRMNLALTLMGVGDFREAREHFEAVIDACERTLSSSHPLALAARANVGVALAELGELAAARDAFQTVYEARSNVLAPDHPELLMTRGNIASLLARLGDFASARAIQEELLAVYERTSPEESPELAATRATLAITLRSLGDLAGARKLDERVLEIAERNESPDAIGLWRPRGSLAITLAELGEADRARALTLELAGAIERHVASAVMTSSAREVESGAEFAVAHASWVLELGMGFGKVSASPAVIERAFACLETLRGAALVSSAISRSAEADPVLREHRERVRLLGQDLARSTLASARKEEIDELRRAKDALESEILGSLAADASIARYMHPIDTGELTSALAEETALVAYWRIRSHGSRTDARKFVAFVLRHGRPCRAIELAPAERIQAAVREWRTALESGAAPARGAAARPSGAGTPDERASGAALRALIIDPLRDALGNTRRWIVVPEDELCGIPLDALPIDGGVLGEKWRIESRRTLRELAWPPRLDAGTGSVVAVGGVEFATDHVAGMRDDAPRDAAAPLNAWQPRFDALPGTATEVRELALLCESTFETPAVLLEGADATRERFATHASTARYLHVATHGWIAPDLDPRGSEAADSRDDVDRRSSSLSPMLRCGLAFAGANAAPDEVGRVRGRVTADELSTWDLSRCELAVLSACDTNVGERRAGQGVASLQKALQMAGARSVITSLWKVPDEATKELMLDFYRRLWVEKKPKHQALWEAKTKLREANDERGEPKYTTRDWAAWVLTGDPN